MARTRTERANLCSSELEHYQRGGLILEERRRAILAILVRNRGEILGSTLSGAQKRLATSMEQEKLVAWVPISFGSLNSRANQKLRLTQVGLAALKVANEARAGGEQVGKEPCESVGSGQATIES